MSVETFSGVIIPCQITAPEIISEPFEFHHPLPDCHLDSDVDPVIAELHRTFTTAIYENHRTVVKYVLDKTVNYGNMVTQEGTILRIQKGKLSIVEAMVDQGSRYLSVDPQR